MVNKYKFYPEFLLMFFLKVFDYTVKIWIIYLDYTIFCLKLSKQIVCPVSIYCVLTINFEIIFKL